MYHFYSPPSQTPQSCRETMEYMPEEHDYSLLPAPIHVGKYVRKHYCSLLEDVIIFSKPPLCPPGKYLRLKRIHFQLPYDVMWQWQHNQVNYQNMIQYQEVSKNLTNRKHHVVFLQLHRPPSVPLKRKRHYCEL